MKPLITIFLLLTSALAFSQESKPYIEVTGSTEMSLDPNIIVVSVSLREFEENRVKFSIDQIDQSFLEAVSKSGIDKKDIALADLNVNSIMVKRKERETFARKTYEIKFSTEKDVMKFLDNTKNVRIDNIYVSKLDHTEIAKYRLEVKVSALKAAEKKADALLDAAGVKRGRPLLIRELVQDDLPQRPLGVYRNMVSNSYANFVIGSNGQSVDADDVQMKKIVIRYEILVQYAID